MADASRAALEYGSGHVLALSQLSDLADLPDDAPGGSGAGAGAGGGSAPGGSAPPLPALPAGQSQDALPVPSQFAPSLAGSQPSQFPSQAVVAAADTAAAPATAPARRSRAARERSPPRPPASSAPTSAPGDESDVDAATAAAVALASPRTVAAAVAAAAAAAAPALRSPARAHRDRRRGPMDEMRQLVRILVKLIPHSAAHVAVGDDGGGNRLSEDQIKAFLAATLGDGAPRPPWGVPAGWAAYLADLYTWVRGGDRVSVDDAASTARRDPGRSWEAVPSALARLGLHPRTWPLPLTEAGLAAAKAHPIDQSGDAGDAALASPAGKRRRGAGEGGGAAAAVAAPAHAAALPRAGATALELRDLDETGLWRAAATALALAAERAGTTAPSALPALAALKTHVAATAARLAGDGGASAPPSAPASAAASPARPRLPDRAAAPSPGGRKARVGVAARAPSD